MTFHFMPKSQGLYSPKDEHDACGIGLYVNLKGEPTHDIVVKGLEMLIRLDHRAGRGSDGQTGDGSGLMVQIPDAFLRDESLGFELPPQGQYAVGMFFFNQDDVNQQLLENKIEQFISQEGQKLLGWRTVPVDASPLSEIAQSTAPIVRQLFIEATNVKDSLHFERQLYLVRKQAEHFAKQQEMHFYCASLSSETMVFKGLLGAEEVSKFYLDLQQPNFMSAFSMVHSRYSTNTFPSWERAHPNRYIIHNGEINTLQGNINWMKAREQQFVSEAFGDDLQKLLPIVDTDGSDSSMLDNAFEFFVLAGRKPAEAAMMMIPEPWTENPHISAEKKDFYNYQSMLMEPWDGPTAICFTDGKQIGAILDRNGLRPARYYVTKDDYMIFSSEVGVVDVEEENILYKERLSPGKMLLIDLEKGQIIADEELKHDVSTRKPYKQWLAQHLVTLEEREESVQLSNLLVRQKVHGYTFEDVQKYLIPIVEEGKDPLGSMGNDTPLAVLSDRPQTLFYYFKQLFAQVTNPPIDSIREHIVTSTMTLLGKEGNLLHPDENNCRRIQLDTPILTPSEWQQLQQQKTFNMKEISLKMSEDLEKDLQNIALQADEAIADGYELIALTDELGDEVTATIPVLLAASSLHQHLLRTGQRTQVSIIVQSGEAREVHHFAALIGYGVDTIYPYLAYATIAKAIEDEHLQFEMTKAFKRYRKAIADGIVKVMAKMGMSTVQSYRGAQIFEAVGISQAVIDQHFTGTKSQLGGIDLPTMRLEAQKRFDEGVTNTFNALPSGSDYQWRANGEHHAFNPKTIHTLQWAARKNDIGLYYQYAEMANEERIGFLRNLFDFKIEKEPLPLEAIESAESIVKRFKTGAMSFGSISQEAHEALAIAMNRLGGRSNSGEGGEDEKRFTREGNGDLKRSAIKQIASGRFGVKSHYLVNADELQIKMAQGAKPGEGGQLPGNKVYPWVADVRGATTGVGLISPPPHHDIYSIEDMAELIHDLKNANPKASISVKLVAKGGVGTIASGVAKGAADKIVISGYDGGTGASPKTSIKHTGLPWELGLAEAHQTLMLNKLRDRVILETDGKLMTGKDVVMAALLGAEEFGFATAPLVVLGCVMMRACHLDTCPVGVATQNPELRAKFMGDPEHIVNYMMFIAEDVRLHMAKLGFRTFDEMVGRTDVLFASERGKEHWKAGQLDLSKLLYQVEGNRIKQVEQNHKLDESLDRRELLRKVDYAIQTQSQIDVEHTIRNIDRVVGTMVGSEISQRYGAAGLREDSIRLRFTGSAGQSFGAFTPNGMLMTVEGDANDYFGKGLSGGKVVAISPIKGDFERNVITGNVCLYGATSGHAYINGRAGERFAVRNSGANIVVEGIGDHGCEYMTGGNIVILGDAGKNFGAGMSGGVAYVQPSDVAAFKKACNMEMIRVTETLTKQDEVKLHHLIEQHYLYTESTKAREILNNWSTAKGHFIKVIPEQYEDMLQKIETFKDQGLTAEEASMKAFMAATL